MYNHLYYMQQALKQAQIAFDLMEVPVGAVIVKNNEIIGVGYNKKEKLKNPVNHAEIEAITNACTNIGDWRLNGTSMYITVEPCIMCAGAILQARISNVYFGIKEPKFGGVVSKDNIFDKSDLNHKVNYEYGFLENSILELMKLFFSKLR